MKVCFISGKYRGSNENEVFENIVHARTIARKLWEENYAVICCHTNSMFMGDKELDHVFLDGDLELLRRSDVVCMLRGWEESEGARAEHALAQELGKSIIYERDPDSDDNYMPD